MSESLKPHSPNLLQSFGATYLLNLPERTDRLRNAMRELCKVDTDAPALVRIYPGQRSPEAHGFPSPGAYGCFQGHLGMLRAAHDAGVASALFLEDDVRLLPDLTQDWPKIAAALQQQPWGMLHLGFDLRYDDTAVRAATPDGLLVESSGPWMLAHCYAVNGPALPDLIAFLEALQQRAPGDPAGGPMHYDGALYHFSQAHPEHPRVRPVRPVAGQRSSPSDIAGMQWFDRNPLTRPVAALLRSMRDRA